MAFDRQIAANLWNACMITVDRFHAKPSRREQVAFLGFADITLDSTHVIPGLKLKLRGVETKVLKGKPHIDVPQDKGADGKWYPTSYFPLTAELREVIVQRIFLSPDVQTAIQVAAQMPIEGVTTTQAPHVAVMGATNPFDEAAGSDSGVPF